MLARALCFALNGIQGEPVTVEADVSNSDKFVFNLVGLPDAAVKESRERVFAALKNSGFTQPYVRTTVNLSPADLRKEGTAFDLPIAVAIIAASRTGTIRMRVRRTLLAVVRNRLRNSSERRYSEKPIGIVLY